MVKNSGTASGEGIAVTDSPEEAMEALISYKLNPHLGEAESQVVLEEVLSSAEASVIFFTDGIGFQRIASVHDYERLMEWHRGPNIGSMGCPGPAHNPEPWKIKIEDTILCPI